MSHDTDCYKLSHMQQGMLFHYLDSSSPGVDLEQILCELPEAVDESLMREAWAIVIARHSALRVAFRWEGVGEPLQMVGEDISVPWDVYDWREDDEGTQRHKLEDYLEADRVAGFKLENPPLMRLAMFRLGDRDWRLLWSFHHILQDGRSFPIALREVFEVYDEHDSGGPLDLPAAPQFREFVEWLHGRDRSREEAYWRQRLKGFQQHTALPLPGGCPALDARSSRGERDLRLSSAMTVRLREFADKHELSMATLVQGAWAILLGRYSGEEDIVFGATRECRSGTVEGAERMIGLFINTLPIRIEFRPEARLLPWLKQLRVQNRELRDYEHTPLFDIQQWSEVEAGAPLFETIVVYDHASLNQVLRGQGGAWANRKARLVERTNFPLTLYCYGDPELSLKLAYDRDRFGDAVCERMLGHFEMLLEGMLDDPRRALGTLHLLTEEEEKQLLVEWNDTAAEYPRDSCIHDLFEQQVDRAPDAIALAFREQTVSYRDLDERANRLAIHLRELGVERDTVIGLFVDRSVEMVVGLLGILKAGAAYLPLDPSYPGERIAFMLKDAQAPMVLTQDHLLLRLPESELSVVSLDDDWASAAAAHSARPRCDAEPQHLAYLIYTSGSTGKPKGVMVEHRNVVNFFSAMDPHLDPNNPGVWLAVTSLSFDISILEILWTLTRGFKVVLRCEGQQDAVDEAANAAGLDFSLFYFASGEGGSQGDKYKLLLEGARFGDRHGFHAMWTPERHFHEFGGLFPNPAVAGAAVASITERIKIRAGSVVLPLHHPLRVAEEWSVVDNLSGGRVEISVASGWQPNDFVLAPENYRNRKELMFENVDVLRRLWRGERLAFPGVDGKPVEVRTLPRPVQAELPVWITTAGNRETYELAGEHGGYVLTHLLGQNTEDLQAKIAAYHEAWKKHGHAGRGRVALMLHTFVGNDIDEVREIVREPMVNYLRSAVALVKDFASAWSAYRNVSGKPVQAQGDEFKNLSDDDTEDLLNFAFERYFETSGLFGTADSCIEMLRRLKSVGVDEIACLIDFGVDAELVLESLQHLDRVRRRASAVAGEEAESVAELIQRHGVTHLQCTPSMARMLLLDPQDRQSLTGLHGLLLGGEVLPVATARELEDLVSGNILNMYGPTETTIWSTLHPVSGSVRSVPIGRPIANTDVYVLQAGLQPAPVGVPGELFIGGAGVVRGYHERPELNHERFIPHPFSNDADARLYRTGDVVRYREDGVLEFLGRSDHQVKIRGHRIELGEIETRLGEHEDVRECAIVAGDDPAGDRRLVAYVVCYPGRSLSIGSFRDWLLERLPEYMVPSILLALEEFPLTPNGKLDRKALPDPEGAQTRPELSFVGPETETELSLAELWSEVLGIEQVGRDDNFFHLGGHSLTAVQLALRIRERFAVEFPMRSFFRSPKLRDLARTLEDRLLQAVEPEELSRLVEEIEQLPEE